jgi:hypothetical protein
VGMNATGVWQTHGFPFLEKAPTLDQLVLLRLKIAGRNQIKIYIFIPDANMVSGINVFCQLRLRTDCWTQRAFGITCALAVRGSKE